MKLRPCIHSQEYSKSCENRTCIIEHFYDPSEKIL